MALVSFKDALYGGLIYCSGDTAAMLIRSEYQESRMLGMLLLGSTLYAIEIPMYFRWLAKRFSGPGLAQSLKRMLLAAAFFNPLWIARHMVFASLFSGNWKEISFAIFPLALTSFCYCLPVTLPVNYLIQNHVGLSWRYVASALFSALMAFYFSMSEVLFG